ncbi:hypothetical protein AAT19DRAFT_16839 [Rhodotorula toruloides]|uniref:Uncharacterized protein n=1 Tax=Rhodotorula toruloides TaxID=5286 RepID=A0A2T0A4I0_RHOTO|nr:hypothetical protein AAT19DRAFT_16839 [Rhodotorula toruloides]
MSPPSKRPRTHSRRPSPPLPPSHLTTLPAPSSSSLPSSTAARAQVQAWEATLLPSRLQWEPGVEVPESVVWKGRVSRGGAEEEEDQDEGEGEEVEVRTDRGWARLVRQEYDTVLLGALVARRRGGRATTSFTCSPPPSPFPPPPASRPKTPADSPTSPPSTKTSSSSLPPSARWSHTKRGGERWRRRGRRGGG